MHHQKHSGIKKRVGDESVFKMPRIALLGEKHWSYLQRRYHMSPRELQVAKLVCQGFRNNDISKILHITLGTVKTHIRNIYRRVQVESKISMLLRFVADTREFYDQYDATAPIPVADLAKPAKVIPAS